LFYQLCIALDNGLDRQVIYIASLIDAVAGRVTDWAAYTTDWSTVPKLFHTGHAT